MEIISSEQKSTHTYTTDDVCPGSNSLFSAAGSWTPDQVALTGRERTNYQTCKGKANPFSLRVSKRPCEVYHLQREGFKKKFISLIITSNILRLFQSSIEDTITAARRKPRDRIIHTFHPPTVGEPFWPRGWALANHNCACSSKNGSTMCLGTVAKTNCSEQAAA